MMQVVLTTSVRRFIVFQKAHVLSVVQADKLWIQKFCIRLKPYLVHFGQSEQYYY